MPDAHVHHQVELLTVNSMLQQTGLHPHILLLSVSTPNVNHKTPGLGIPTNQAQRCRVQLSSDPCTAYFPKRDAGLACTVYGCQTGMVGYDVSQGSFNHTQMQA